MEFQLCTCNSLQEPLLQQKKNLDILVPTCACEIMNTTLETGLCVVSAISSHSLRKQEFEDVLVLALYQGMSATLSVILSEEINIDLRNIMHLCRLIELVCHGGVLSLNV